MSRARFGPGRAQIRANSIEERAALRRLLLVMQARTNDTVPVPLSTAERRNTLRILV